MRQKGNADSFFPNLIINNNLVICICHFQYNMYIIPLVTRYDNELVAFVFFEIIIGIERIDTICLWICGKIINSTFKHWQICNCQIVQVFLVEIMTPRFKKKR